MDIKTKNKKRKWDSTSGLLTLEASFALTIFILIMLFMSSFFVVFEARNEVAHVLLTTADSLALDAFANEMPKDDSIQSLLYSIYGSTAKSNGTFTNATKWYSGDEKSVEQAIRERFFAYLAGGNDEEASRILENLNIVDGMDSFDFSGSRIENGKLYLEVSYKVKYEFQAFGFESITLRQSCCSKIWGI